MIVRPEHLYAAGFCSRGIKDWMTANGFDWRAFYRDGLPAGVLLETKDPFAARAVEFAEKTNG